jgi:hypothetical protein
LAPLSVIELPAGKAIGTVPVLVSATVLAALAVPSVWSAKVTGDGSNVANGAIPVPFIVTVPRVTPRLVMVRVAERGPTAPGVKVTLMVHGWVPTARLVPQVLVCVKSAALVPAMAKLVGDRATGIVPVFVRVAVNAVLPTWSS